MQEKNCSGLNKRLKTPEKDILGNPKKPKKRPFNGAEFERDEAKRKADFLDDELARKDAEFDELEEAAKTAETRQNALEQYLKDLSDIEAAAKRERDSGANCPSKELQDTLSKAEMDLIENSDALYPQGKSPFSWVPAMIADDTGGGGPIYGKSKDGEGNGSKGEGSDK